MLGVGRFPRVLKSMTGRIRFGPRLDCFDNSNGPPFTLSSQQQKKQLAAKRGQFTVFDDEPVQISPSHPLAKQQVELSEVWTRKDEDLDWDSLICSSDSLIAKQQKEAAPRSLDELTSIRMAKDWVAVAKSEDDIQKIPKDTERSSASSLARTQHTEAAVRRRRSAGATASNEFSTTGDEDSRVSFALHDLTGPILDSFQAQQLMHYMGVNNLDFHLARRFAPTDNEEAYVGTIQDGVFKAASNAFQEGIEERIIPEGKMTIRTASGSEQTPSTRNQLGNLQDLIQQLIVSRNELMRLCVECHATLDAADQMMHRASEWFQMMLDDLEKRIKDERALVMRHGIFMEREIGPILQKLHDLTVLYETLNFLDKKTSMNDQTMRTSRRNIQLARENIAKLSSRDSKLKASSTLRNEFVPMAAEISTTFHRFEEALLELMTFTLSSSAASRLMETILTQMIGIHRVVMKEIPRTTLAQYLAAIGAHNENEPTTFAGMPELDDKLKALFAPPRKRKITSYLKLDVWPSQELVDIGTNTADSSTLILSANSPTEPLSPYHESERSDSLTESCPSCREAMRMTEGSTTWRSESERPPTAVGSPGCSPSESAHNVSFDTATLLANPRRNSAALKTPSMKSTVSSITDKTSSSYVPPQKTPDPIKLSAAKKASESVRKPEEAQNLKEVKKGRRSSSKSSLSRTKTAKSVSSRVTSKKRKAKIIGGSLPVSPLCRAEEIVRRKLAWQQPRTLVDSKMLSGSQEEDAKKDTKAVSKTPRNRREIEDSAR